MSAHILIVDLPDDGKCDGCKHKMQSRIVMDGNGGLYGYWCSKINHPIGDSRPSSCPLIPVDRVMERMRVLMREMPGGGESAAYRKGVEHTAVILRDELGLEE